MYGHQRSSPYLYNTSPYAIPVYGTVAYQTPPLDITWYNTWPNFKSIFLSTAIVICSAAVIGLEIANMAIEGSKETGSQLGSGPGKVGAGIWSGFISFLAAIFILVIVFKRNKRIAATIALIAVTFAFCFLIVLIGLIGNALQNNLYTSNQTDADNVQNRLLIAMISIALVILILFMIFFSMFIRVFFSPSTRQSSKL